MAAIKKEKKITDRKYNSCNSIKNFVDEGRTSFRTICTQQIKKIKQERMDIIYHVKKKLQSKKTFHATVPVRLQHNQRC